MRQKTKFYGQSKKKWRLAILGFVFLLIILGVVYFYFLDFPVEEYQRVEAEMVVYQAPVLDIADYERRLIKLANQPIQDLGSTTATNTTHSLKSLWPVKTVYPKTGAILPFKRVIAYYGNLYSTRMGILGEYSQAEVLERLALEVRRWEEADPTTPVQPALHYIAVTAQEQPGADGLYRLRMPGGEIEKILEMAKPARAIVFLDIQVGLSDLRKELPLLEEYLKKPQVHLGVDPEFYMKTGQRPGTVIGSMDAEDVNYAIDYLTKLVRANNLPPKILVIHRFTQKMVTNYHLIKPTAEVQVVMHMDGWGSPARKKNTYYEFIASEPVQFTGFKLFYKNDLKQEPHRLMTPVELLDLKPRPIYIQYQ